MKEKQSNIAELLNFSIINIDKPTGPTSFSVSDYVRKTLGLNKTSHFGTLDPMVTGCLPIALGRACKLTGFFLGHTKEYVGIMHIHKDMKIEEIQKIINDRFLGKIKQLPPKKSRVKRQIREREILRFELLEQEEKDILFIACVQGGTYIRKLISDLGEIIGGAHMAELRRTKAGIFSEEKMYTLYEFDSAVEDYKKGNDKKLREMLIPAEEAIKQVFPEVQLKDEREVKKLLTGKPIFKNLITDSDKLEKDDLFAVFFKGKFIEIAKVVEEREIFARPEFVFN